MNEKKEAYGKKMQSQLFDPVYKGVIIYLWFLEATSV